MTVLASQPNPSDLRAVPRHVAIIMDGNGRWAKLRGKPRTMGHRSGVEAVRRTVEAAAEIGIEYLTLYGFSTENWKRPESEVSDLMGLLRLFIKRELATLHKNGVRIRIIGDRTRFDDDIRVLLANAEERTQGNTRLNLTIALSYGARAEIADAMRQIAQKVAAGEIQADAIDESVVEAHLMTVGMPDPDLLIRTSGEQRISNFLLWQSAYTEFVFDDVLWPDFGREHLEKAIENFAGRERRFGAVI
ncbi:MULTISPECIES: isoprenyl transferase [Thalassospira]|jgi:undecaprenyl diphosphate synthase|uniref:Isoprenyl transferase n=1 Tax=Thalassospira xiamenensis TaxID=220697 RepID=A0ABR5Y3V2_9PROT|nr:MULTISPECIES: isoprenyl transferase [Thalassospira]MAL28552.1 di-trans,poly-cis-decaprenylcistransferase [Thalassospira sp.]MBR9780982.1 isoprenyl transferase [Rhodospirillales bacterium]KZD05027.1 UDP pyrophosphate synthase [Thalassospira xiamenensis]KZD11720.1 UDP pyrophosphate synthase [Thalassospira xiamenensis]MBL4840517.1 isoprenyl transferase [Thalassospira sp.]|tara:strand:+ start:2320 stop:3060 length:741 start_codon:yes stop_codon:yes gene_type:complete